MELLRVAKNCVNAIQHEAQQMGVPVTACVVDATGALILLERMDDAIPVSLEMAQNKARTAALIGQSTSALAGLVQPGQPLYGLTHASGGKFVALGGGVPIAREGRVIAGVGVSGGTVEQDVHLAEAGAQAGREQTAA